MVSDSDFIQFWHYFVGYEHINITGEEVKSILVPLEAGYIFHGLSIFISLWQGEGTEAISKYRLLCTPRAIADTAPS